MSKSSSDQNSKILLTTPATQIQQIIKRALTDSISDVYPSPDRPAVTNLINILSAFEQRPIDEITLSIRGLSMKQFKERVAESIIVGLRDIQQRYENVKDNSAWLEKVRQEGNTSARQVAGRRIQEIKKAIGLL
jgi:tryptophanyl-tRNA synthetase